MNVPLLREIAQAIQLKPKEFDMGCFHTFDGRVNKETLAEVGTGCGTMHCIAGWAQILGKANPKANAERIGQEVLELSDDQAEKLFWANAWPEGFGGWKATAVQAAERIEKFIATDGAE